MDYLLRQDRDGWMRLDMRQLLPRIQWIEQQLLNAWSVGPTKPRTPKRAIVEFSYLVFQYAPPPVHRFPEAAEILIMEQFLLNEYPFSSAFPFRREEMREAIQAEGGTYLKQPVPERSHKRFWPGKGPRGKQEK